MIECPLPSQTEKPTYHSLILFQISIQSFSKKPTQIMARNELPCHWDTKQVLIPSTAQTQHISEPPPSHLPPCQQGCELPKSCDDLSSTCVSPMTSQSLWHWARMWASLNVLERAQEARLRNGLSSDLCRGSLSMVRQSAPYIFVLSPSGPVTVWTRVIIW